MTQCLRQEMRTAKKQHVCDYCGGIIKKGEKYSYGAYKDNIFFDWKSHERCNFIVNELWDYIDPYDGVGEDDFQYGCGDFCHDFVCPDCPQFDKEYKECNEDRIFCLDRIAALLQTHKLVWNREKYGVKCFKVVPRDQKTE